MLKALGGATHQLRPLAYLATLQEKLLAHPPRFVFHPSNVSSSISLVAAHPVSPEVYPIQPAVETTLSFPLQRIACLDSP